VKYRFENFFDSIQTEGTMETKGKLKRASKNFKNYFMEYAAHSSIHGIRYLCEPNRSVLEKLCWLIVVLVSFIGCSLTLISVWIRYRENPVMMTIDKQPTPLWDIPFPAVTICPAAKLDRQLFNISKFVAPFLPKEGKQIQANFTKLNDKDRYVKVIERMF
jgi:hypothetical protein